MPWTDPQLSAQFFTIFGEGPVAQTSVIGDAPPLTAIAAGGNFTSDVVVSNGYKVVAIGLTSSQAGAITIQRYLDREGTVVATTSPTSATIVAATPLVAVCNATTDGIPFASFVWKVTNTSGSPAVVSKFYALLQAQ